MTFISKSLVTVLTKMTNRSKLICRPFTVCIEGNIGSGKTTFVSHFKKLNNTTVLQEPVELWQDVGGTNLLELLYTKPARYSFLFQSYVQLTMLQLHTYKTPFPYKIMERSVYSGMCFVEHMKRTKIMSNVEVMVLQDWYDWCIKNANIETDLIVYLRTSPEIVHQRMKKRARKEETAVSLEYLKQIHSIHDEWLYHKTLFNVSAPVLVLDGNKNLEEMLDEFENCKNHIFKKKVDIKQEENTIDLLP
ncbi:deoxynucleoside kinase isoform X2 [Colletes latitarsis]|uniref:deoxynucleoside kinase isoform X2 n=1 Tax=Colletes latitarsis TaxID=2605962 RepID=UPI0040364616